MQLSGLWSFQSAPMGWKWDAGPLHCAPRVWLHWQQRCVSWFKFKKINIFFLEHLVELVLSQARNPLAVSLLTFPNISQNFYCKFPCHYLVWLKYVFPGESDQRRCWEPQRCHFSMNQFYLSLIADCIPHPGLGGPAYVYNSKNIFENRVWSNSVEERPCMWEKMQDRTSEATLHTDSVNWKFPFS